LNHAFAGRSQQLLSPYMSAPDPALFPKKSISEFGRPGNRLSDVDNNYALVSFIQNNSSLQSSIERVEGAIGARQFKFGI
jgi:hypothetical protein